MHAVSGHLRAPRDERTSSPASSSALPSSAAFLPLLLPFAFALPFFGSWTISLPSESTSGCLRAESGMSSSSTVSTTADNRISSDLTKRPICGPGGGGRREVELTVSLLERLAELFLVVGRQVFEPVDVVGLLKVVLEILKLLRRDAAVVTPGHARVAVCRQRDRGGFQAGTS